jgi:hypothetical protein
MSISGFRSVIAPPKKRKADLADSWPQLGRYLKCFKHIIIDPKIKCLTLFKKKNCKRYNKGKTSCEKVSLAFLYISI